MSRLTLGTFAASGALAGAFESIATLSGTGSSNSITFSSIPSTYKHLQIRGIGGSGGGSATADYGNIGVRFNGDTNSDYTYHLLRGYHDATTGYKQTGASAAINYGLTGVAYLKNSMDSRVAINVFDILDYSNTNKYKTVRCISGVDGLGSNAAVVQLASSVWSDTSVINSVTIFASNGNWFSNTTFALYGIKG